MELFTDGLLVNALIADGLHFLKYLQSSEDLIIKMNELQVNMSIKPEWNSGWNSVRMCASHLYCRSSEL